MNCIMNRRSVRRYHPRPVETEKLDRILRAGMQAPSAHNTQPWEFLVVTEAAAREAVSRMSPYARMAKDAPVLIIPCCDMHKGLVDSDGGAWWIEDMAACTENILLQIVEEGLGGVWLGFYPGAERIETLKEYFRMPEHLVPFSVVALGYAQEEKTPEDRFDPARIHLNGF